MPLFTSRRTLQPGSQPCCTWGLFAFVTVILSHAAAMATPIAVWTFETSPPSSLTDDDYPSSISADIGSNLAKAGGHHSDTSTVWKAAVGNGSNNSFDASFWNTTDWFQFEVPTTGFEDISVSWDIARSSLSAPSMFELQYSTTGNGGTFYVGLNDFTVLTNDAYGLPTRSSWNNTTHQSAYSFSANLSAISALDNNANVVFRLVAVNAGSAAATVRVDNFAVSGTAVPEPASYAMLLLGGLWALFTRRRILRHH